MIPVTARICRIELTIATLMIAAGASAADNSAAEQVAAHADHATKQVIGRSRIGAPIVLVELQRRVRYSDLDLSIPSNAKVFKTRIRDEARRLCEKLDRSYPISASRDHCAYKAEKDMMPLADAAIAAAQAHKLAAK